MITLSGALDAVKQFCTCNLTLKALSLGVAVCIWSFTSISRETRYDLVLPVELRNSPPGYSLASSPPAEVQFTLSGPSLLLDGVRRSNAVLILNLHGIKPGKTIFSHLETYLKLPEGIRVIKISPASVEIDLVREKTTFSEGDS